MQFSMGRFCVEITVTDNRKPWELGRIARRRFAELILVMVGTNGYKIDRIKALRAIARANGWSNFTLRDTKEWVEAAYAQNGSGIIL